MKLRQRKQKYQLLDPPSGSSEMCCAVKGYAVWYDIIFLDVLHSREMLSDAVVSVDHGGECI